MRRTSIIASLVVTGALLALALSGSASGTTARGGGGASVAAAASGPRLSADVLAARQATAKYAGNLARARADGYRIITRMIPNMGYHFLNSKVKTFDVRKPAILVYEHRHGVWQLGALEWVFTSMPAQPPLPGAKYGVFGAACHYVDGTFVFQTDQSKCAARSPQTRAKFSFWHPRLITMHFWVWYPNPAGIYSGINPLADQFNQG